MVVVGKLLHGLFTVVALLVVAVGNKPRILKMMKSKIFLFYDTKSYIFKIYQQVAIYVVAPAGASHRSRHRQGCLRTL